jgi:hypothetical protein
MDVGLSTVTFESGSRLSSIGPYAFHRRTSLSSICIPSFVKSVCGYSFAKCQTLSTVTIESGSPLSRIGKGRFRRSVSLLKILILPRSARFSRSVSPHVSLFRRSRSNLAPIFGGLEIRCFGSAHRLCQFPCLHLCGNFAVSLSLNAILFRRSYSSLVPNLRFLGFPMGMAHFIGARHF